jgi:hypothetical protein
MCEIASLQYLAVQKQLPGIAALEVSTSWKGEAPDVLCYGFVSENKECDEKFMDEPTNM